jgi:hypothetical protein
MNLLCINRCNLQSNSVKNKTEHKVETTGLFYFIEIVFHANQNSNLGILQLKIN